MKITVITPYDSSNFGAFLQAYCLKAQLEKMGHTVNHIMTRKPEYVRELYYKEKPTRKKDILFRWRFEKKKAYGIRKFKLFQKDQKYFSIVQSNDAADVYILGSDEIWNINQSVFQKNIFWGRGLEPVISYAASIGNADIKELTQAEKYVDDVKSLKAVLVRDIRTRKFVESIGKQAEIVCDPTMLISVTAYGQEINDKYISTHRCFLVYAYYVSEKGKKAIKNYARKNGMKVVSCCFWHDWCDYQCECGPLKFSSLIRQCKAVFTTTFHGSIFSILNHANFVSVPISTKTNQLLEQFGMQERLIEEEKISENMLDKILNSEHIDYYSVDEQITAIRKDSIGKLETALRIANGG